MNQNKEFPGWFLWMYEKGPVLIVLGGVLLLASVAGFASYLDYRLDQVEGRIQSVPPSSYQLPNLEDYALGDIDVTQLAVRRLVYVPVYSHVYYLGGAPYSLETTLSIRNIAPDRAVYLKSVEYFDTNGKLVKTHLDQTIRLGPLQTIEFLVERRDSTGGSGANFVVEWLGNHESDRPLVEAVMVGVVGTQGIGFGRKGIEIPETSFSDRIE